MMKLTQMDLLRGGYQILNGKITEADLSMAEQGVCIMLLSLAGDGWGVDYGGHVLGKGSVGAAEFSGEAQGIEQIMRVMDTVGVSHFKDLKGSYIRIAVHQKDNGRVNVIGNIIADKWFDIADFFAPPEVKAEPVVEEIEQTIDATVPEVDAEAE
jgi:hypothetical protein